MAEQVDTTASHEGYGSGAYGAQFQQYYQDYQQPQPADYQQSQDYQQPQDYQDQKPSIQPLSASAQLAADLKSSECNIYINSLPKEINDEKLTKIFCTFGDIESARVMVDFNTRISRGYGFVKFKSPEAAKNAIQTMDGFKLSNNTLNVKFANESTGPMQTVSNNIFLKGLPVTVKADQLREACAKYGAVLDLRILEDFATGLSRGQALVRFEDVKGAEAAVNDLHGQPYPVAGNVVPLVAKFAENDDEKTERKNKMRKRLAAAQRYLPYQHGAVVPPTYADPAYQYPYYQDAYAAYPYAQPNPYAQYPPGATPNSPPAAQAYPPHAQPAYEAAAYPPHAAPHAHAAPIVAHAPGQDPNVYVYHLPPDTSDVQVYSRFGKYGSVLSIKIARDPAGLCKGYGFIRFSSMDSAMRAIAGEHGQRVGNKTLSVSLAKQKGAA